MLDLIDQVQTAIIATAASPWVYLVVAAVVFIDGFFPPVPSESVVVALAAFAVSGGRPDPWLLVLAATLGAVLADNLAFRLGRTAGLDRRRWAQGRRAAAAIEWARTGLEHRATLLILVARYIPVGRIAVNLVAGATGFPARRFVPLSVLAGASWAAYSVGVGMLAGALLDDQPLLGAAIGVTIALVVGLSIDRVTSLLARRRARIRQQRTAADAALADSRRALDSVVVAAPGAPSAPSATCPPSAPSKSRLVSTGVAE